MSHDSTSNLEDRIRNLERCNDNQRKQLDACLDLLEACELCAEWYDLVKQNYPDMAGLIRGLDAARKAVAKARKEV